MTKDLAQTVNFAKLHSVGLQSCIFWFWSWYLSYYWKTPHWQAVDCSIMFNINLKLSRTMYSFYSIIYIYSYIRTKSVTPQEKSNLMMDKKFAVWAEFFCLNLILWINKCNLASQLCCNMHCSNTIWDGWIRTRKLFSLVLTCLARALQHIAVVPEQLPSSSNEAPGHEFSIWISVSHKTR